MESPITSPGGIEPHPLNRDFVWQDRRGPFRVIDEVQACSWNERGYFLLREVITRAQVDALLSELDPLEQKTEEYLQSKGGRVNISRAGELTFTAHVVLHSSVVRAFTALPLLANLSLDLLGPDCRLYWDQAVYKKPRNPRDFPWHQDNGYNFVEPQDYLTCWIPLTPATVNNGCPWVIPGIHRGGTLQHRPTPLGYQCMVDPEGAVPVEADPGDVVVFSSLTPHRTGPNLTSEVRKAYIVQYAHDRAVMVSPDGTERRQQQNPGRQFIVARAGEPVGGP